MTVTPEDRDIGRRIRQIRTSRAMSQDELGQKIGESRDIIKNLESGRTALKGLRAKRIAEVLFVAVDDLYAPTTAPVPRAGMRKKFRVEDYQPLDLVLFDAKWRAQAEPDEIAA
jgi:transcriptional regulator with XRE-family HTH domain